VAKSKGDGNKNSLKETEIGMIPEDWNVERLGDVAELLRGLSWRKEEANKSGRGLPVVAIPNIGIGTLNFDFHHFLTREVSTKKLLKIGDILFVGSSGSIRNIGRNVLVRFLPLDKISFASFLALIRAEKGKVTSDFLYYLINSKWIDFKKFTKRAADGKYNFQLRDFQSNATIPLPPPHEQQKIARVLSKIQQAIEQQDKIIEATKNLKKSLMQKLFTEGFGHTEFKETEIGQIPKGWKIESAEEICLKVTDGTHDTPKPTKSGYYLVTSKHIKEGYIDFSEAYFINEKDFKEVNRRSQVHPLDVIFSMIGTIGNVVVVKNEYPNFAIKNVGLFKTGGNYTKSFWLYYYFQSPLGREYIENNTKGTTQKYVPLYALRKFTVALPSDKEMQEIVYILRMMDKKIEAEEKRKSTLKELFKTMLHKLMTGEIRLKEIEL